MNFGTISSLLKPDLKEKVIELLRDFKDYFAWDYTDIPGLSREVVEHHLLIKPKFYPFQ